MRHHVPPPCWLSLIESLELRVKDIDIERRQIVVRQGKGRKDRVTMLPNSVMPLMINHLEGPRRRQTHVLNRGALGVLSPAAKL